MKILVVEDDLTLSAGICFELDCSGYLTIPAYNCKKAIHLIQNDPIDLVILDVNLPDEPTGNLDPTNSWEIMKLLEEANERGTTVLVVTHNQEIVNEMRKRVVTMKKGVIVSDEQKGGYNNED